MPIVETSMVAKTGLQTAYEITKDFESFASYMPNVNSIEIKERGEGYAISAWSISVLGRQLDWLERDEFDDANFRIRYKQIEGKLAKFQGAWWFEEIDEGVRISLSVDFDIGKPSLSTLLNPVLIKAIEDNSNKMLLAIKERAERKGG